MSLSTIRLLFAVAGVYDFFIGLAFLLFGPRLFDSAGVPQPNHWAYIQFGALLLVVFGLMFFAVARTRRVTATSFRFECYSSSATLAWLRTTGSPRTVRCFSSHSRSSMVSCSFSSCWRTPGGKPSGPLHLDCRSGFPA